MEISPCVCSIKRNLGDNYLFFIYLIIHRAYQREDISFLWKDEILMRNFGFVIEWRKQIY